MNAEDLIEDAMRDIRIIKCPECWGVGETLEGPCEDCGGQGRTVINQLEERPR